MTVSDITFVPRDLTSNPGISYDVVGLGNALVDVIAQTDDAFLEQQQLAKGSMALVDTDRAVSLYEALQGGIEMSGGSAANTMCGIASFGGRAAYIGDSIYDIMAAKNADVPSVAVSFGFLHGPVEDMGADAIIDHFDDLGKQCFRAYFFRPHDECSISIDRSGGSSRDHSTR